MTDDTSPDPSAADARLLLERAGQLGAVASAGVSWPYIATLLTIGAATSTGTLAMSLTTGAGYAVAMCAMLAWVVIAIGSMLAFGRATRIGFKRRWRFSILAWAVAYVVAILLASSSQGTDVVGGAVGAVLILLVTVTGAVVEARS